MRWFTVSGYHREDQAGASGRIRDARRREPSRHSQIRSQPAIELLETRLTPTTSTSMLAAGVSAITTNVATVKTTTTVTASPNPGTYGGTITLTATVTATSGTPTGTVTFYDGTTSLGTASLNGSGATTLATTALPVGNSSITAVYGGDSTYIQSTSAAITVTVGSDNQIYVNQLYLNLLGRMADNSELSHWTNLLDNGTSRQHVVSKIARSHESVTTAVSTIFQNLLGTTPTQPQIKNALSMPHASVMNITASILGSRTFFKTQAGGTISGFLSALGNDVLGSSLPTDTQTYFTKELDQGVSTLTVTQQLLSSKMGVDATINSLYEQYLGRAADSTEQTHDAHLIADGVMPGQVAVDLLASTEYYDLALATITPDLLSTSSSS